MVSTPLRTRRLPPAHPLPPAAPARSAPRLTYHQQRQLRCRRAVLVWLRRWGAYLGMAGVLLAAGSNSPLAVLVAALGALAAPLLHVVQGVQLADGTGLAPLLLCLLAYTAAGCLPPALTRPLWWPPRWALAECALPLSSAQLRASDRRLLAWVLLPLPLLAAAGALAMGLAHPPLWRQGLATALGLLVLCALASACCVDSAVAQLRARQRRGPGYRREVSAAGAFGAVIAGSAGSTGSADGARAAGRAGRTPSLWHDHLGPRPVVAWPALPAWRVLLWWPLLRGRARRTVQGLLLGGLASPALAAGPLATAPADAGWWLAALSAVALASTAWLRSRSRDELAPLWQALPALPLPVVRLDRLRRGLCLLPATAGLLLAGPVLLHLGARPALLLAWTATLALACWREAHPPPPAADQHAVRWLFSLVLAVVLGTEVMP